MEIGAKVKVKLALGEWYTGSITKAVPYFHGETRYEVQGKEPRPFVTIVRAESLVTV